MDLMMAKCDEKGRLYIPKKYQSKIKRDVYIIELKEGLLIVPIPEDPITELKDIGKALPKKSLAEFKAIIEEEAMKEIMKKRS